MLVPSRNWPARGWAKLSFSTGSRGTREPAGFWAAGFLLLERPLLTCRRGFWGFCLTIPLLRTTVCARRFGIGASAGLCSPVGHRQSCAPCQMRRISMISSVCRYTTTEGRLTNSRVQVPRPRAPELGNRATVSIPSTISKATLRAASRSSWRIYSIAAMSRSDASEVQRRRLTGGRAGRCGRERPDARRVPRDPLARSLDALQR